MTKKKAEVPEEIMALANEKMWSLDQPSFERKKRFKALRRKVWDIEEENRQFLIFFKRDSQNWWMLGGTSALIYYHMIAPQIGRRETKLSADKDYGVPKWMNGVIMIRSAAAVGLALEKAGYKTVVKTSAVFVFMLDKRLEEETIEVWKNAERERDKMFNKLVVPQNVYPRVTNMAEVLHREIVVSVSKLGGVQREMYGNMGVELSFWVYYNVVGMANGRIAPREYFEKAIRKTEEMNDWLVVANTFKVFDGKTKVRIATWNCELCDMLKSELKALGKAVRKGTGEVAMRKKDSGDEMRKGNGEVKKGGDDVVEA